MTLDFGARTKWFSILNFESNKSLRCPDNEIMMKTNDKVESFNFFQASIKYFFKYNLFSGRYSKVA